MNNDDVGADDEQFYESEITMLRIILKLILDTGSQGFLIVMNEIDWKG